MSPQLDARKIAAAILAVGISAVVSQAADSGGATFTQVQKQVVAGNKVAAVGAKVSAGTPLATQANSRAEIKLPNGGVARIGQGSNFVFDSHKMTLSQGSALLDLPAGKTTVATPSLNCAAGSAVMSIHAAKNYEACFVLNGRGTVNGQPLIAGEAFVREKGVGRKIVFDVQRLLQTSSLISKFPQAPWVKQTFAVGVVQHDLATGSHAATAVLNSRSRTAPGLSTTSAGGGGVANTALVALQSKAIADGRIAGGNLAVAFGNGAQGRISSGSLTLTSGMTVNTGSIQGGNLIAANGFQKTGATFTGATTGASVATFTGSSGSIQLQPSGGSLTVSNPALNVGQIGGMTVSLTTNPISAGNFMVNGSTVKNGTGTVFINGTNQQYTIVNGVIHLSGTTTPTLGQTGH